MGKMKLLKKKKKAVCLNSAVGYLPTEFSRQNRAFSNKSHSRKWLWPAPRNVPITEGTKRTSVWPYLLLSVRPLASALPSSCISVLFKDTATGSTTQPLLAAAAAAMHRHPSLLSSLNPSMQKLLLPWVPSSNANHEV